MTENKNTIYVILTLLVLILVFLFVGNINNITKTVSNNINESQKNQALPPGRELPKFIFGSVSRVEGLNVFVNLGTEEKKVVTDDKTIIVKQIKEGNGYKNIPARSSEIKSSVQLVIYYSTNSGSEYKADKLQILNF